MSSSPVPQNTHRVGERCMLNLSRAQTSSRWCGVVVRRGDFQLRSRPCHLTRVQNYRSVAKSPRVAKDGATSLHLRHWADRNTLNKLEVARTLEKSAHPCTEGFGSGRDHDSRALPSILSITFEYNFMRSKKYFTFLQKERAEEDISISVAQCKNHRYKC
ncbi:hypothetical protein TNCV_2344481 [Trichonephila clavipes]|nr:hypothetical protein TNCV_2344481 [Trichonephila clavipes]